MKKLKKLIYLSIRYLIIYSFFILVFAAIYRFVLNDSFYQSNPETDPTFTEQINEFLTRVCGHINADSKVIKNKTCIATFNSPIKFNSKNFQVLTDPIGKQMGYGQAEVEREITLIMITFQKFEGHELYFRIYNLTRVAGGKHNGSGESSGDLIKIDLNKFENDTSIDMEIIEPSGNNAFFKPVDHPEIKNYTEYLAKYGNAYKQPIYYDLPNIPVLKLLNKDPDPFYRNLKNFLVDKRPHKETSFLKMIYFSGVTIATIGYGDIVPISWEARILTIMEAVIGIILLAIMGASIYEELRNN